MFDGRAHRLLLSLLAVTVLSAGCAPGSMDGEATTRGLPIHPPSLELTNCRLSAKLVPSCGALWGASTPPPVESTMAALERAVGRRFDVIHRYHDIDGEIPDATERAQVAQGQLLHIAIAARDYQQGNQPPVTWAAIADGQYDASLRQQAQGIASLKVPTFVTFEQEADQKDKLGVRGSAAEFIAAWRHIHDVYRASGATNAIWVWGMTGIEQNLDRAGSLWPGNEYVDWISWDVYNQSGCHSQRIRADRYISFADQTLVFYNWLHEHGTEYDIDATKPMMLSEVGSSIYPDDPSRTADWYAAIPDFLRDHQQIKAVGLWHSQTDRCDYRFSRNAVVLQGVSEAGKDPWVDYWHGEPAKALR